MRAIYIDPVPKRATELTDYIATGERWLRGQFTEDGWLVK